MMARILLIFVALTVMATMALYGAAIMVRYAVPAVEKQIDQLIDLPTASNTDSECDDNDSCEQLYLDGY